MKKIWNQIAKVNLIQFIPAILVISFVGNSILGYTAPKVKNLTTANAKETTKTTKTKKAGLGNLDLSKIKDGTYEGEGTGYRGKVKVSVTVKSHKITGIKILSNSDDAAYFNRASSGVIKNILSNQSLDVDVVSGATYSSKGIIAAVKNALTGETDNSSATGSNTASGSGSTNIGSSDESGTYKDGTYVGSGQGFHGIVRVSVTIKNSNIKKLNVLENHDDAAYFGRAKATLLPLIIKKQSTNVDAVSGATYSSRGIITAIRNALKKAEVKSSGSSTASDTSSDSSSNSNNDKPTEVVSGDYNDGVYEGTGEGFNGNITVSIRIQKAKIVEIKLVKNEADDTVYFNKAFDLIYDVIAKQSTDVDVVSGATYSSKGIISAVNQALKKALKNPNDANDNTDTTPTTPADDDSADITGETVLYTGTAKCEPDMDYDFTIYELNLEITVVNKKVTGIQNVTIQVDPSAQWEKSTNESYTKTALLGLSAKLVAGVSDVDVVSGATCSSKALIEAYRNATSKIK